MNLLIVNCGGTLPVDVQISSVTWLIQLKWYLRAVIGQTEEELRGLISQGKLLPSTLSRILSDSKGISVLNVLESFRKNPNVVILGSSGGIGEGFVSLFNVNQKPANIFSCSRGITENIRSKNTLRFDFKNENSIEALSQEIAAQVDSLDLVIVATGILHRQGSFSPEKDWKALNLEQLQEVFAINTFGPTLAIKYFLPMLNKLHKSVFAVLSARVGSISDNRLGGWYSYRASKSALNMIVKTASIELSRKNTNGICVALHPGTVDTKLSSPYKSKNLKRKIFSNTESCKYLMEVINRLEVADNGKFFAWDGNSIPY